MIDLDKKCTVEKCCVCAHEERCRDNRTSLAFDLACPKEIRIRLNDYGHMYTDKEKVLMLDILTQYALGNIVEEEKEKEMIEPRPRKFEDVCKETKTYEQGLEEAWEIARKIAVRGVSEGGYSISDVDEIFGKDRLPCTDILRTMNIHEVKAKIDAWEAEKNKPKMGDVVKCRACSTQFIGIYYGKGRIDHWVLVPGDSVPQRIGEDWIIKKTGKHFDIQGMLDGIKTED